MTKSFTKKLFFLAISSLMALNVWGDATPSDELFATYQKHGDRFYKTSGAEATLSEDYYDWNVNYYIVACGDSMLLRATTTEERGFDMAAAWQTQLRVWTEGFTQCGRPMRIGERVGTCRDTCLVRRIPQG